MENSSELKIQVDDSLKQEMSKFAIDWSDVCLKAIEDKLAALSSGAQREEYLFDIDLDLTDPKLVTEGTDTDEENIPDFSYEVYKCFKKAWYCAYGEDSKPPSSQQLKDLFAQWYDPLFDEEAWLQKWEDYYYYGSVPYHLPPSEREKFELVSSFTDKYLESGTGLTIYTIFVHFVSKLIFDEQLFDVTKLDPFLLTSVAIEERDSLPEEAGIYFVIDDSSVYYIGMSVNLQHRWYSHHRQAEFDKIPHLRIAYIDGLSVHYLRNMELLLIQHLTPKLNIQSNPLLNYSRVK